MRVDAFGVVHPESSDVPSLAGALHITECGPCKELFGAEVVGYCNDLAEAYEADQRDKAKVRKH
jgi:hypothetical protein